MSVNLVELRLGMSTVKPGRLSLSLSLSVTAQSNLIQRKALDAADTLSDHGSL